jgi:adenine phosphoribosyltransferase
VDDVLATGGTLAAATKLLRTGGATVTDAAVVLELSALNGRATLPDLAVTSLYVV